MTKPAEELDADYAAEMAALDALTPATHPASDATAWRRLVAAAEGAHAADTELHAAVRAARETGETWTTIATALGISRQAAWNRFHDPADPRPAGRRGPHAQRPNQK